MKPNIVTHKIVEDVFLSSNENVANQTAFFIPTPTQRQSSTSTPRVENPQGAEGGARPKRRASGFATASPDSLAHNQIQINLRNLEKAKAASGESNEELKKLQLVVENRRKEVEENQRRKTAKLNEKIERQRLEREEKKRVEETRKRQEEVEKTNAAVMSELAAKKISDQECQRMIQILKDLNMKDDQQIDEDEVQIEEVTSGDTDGFISANRRRKSAKKSPTKISQEPPRQGQDQGKQGYQNFIMNRQSQQKIADQRKGNPVDYQEGCGLQCASRGPHTHQQPFKTPMEPPRPRQDASSRRHHQRRVQQGEVTEDMVVVLSEEASLRKSMLAQQQAKEARPPKKFEDNGSMEFRGVLQWFQAAVNIPGLSTKQKMIELSHWFGGVAASLIASYSVDDDSD